jgi:hypothetical protein
MMAEMMVKISPMDGFADSGWNRIDICILVCRLAVLPLLWLPNDHGVFVNKFARLLFITRALRVLGESFTEACDLLISITQGMYTLKELLTIYSLGVFIASIFCMSLFPVGGLNGRCVLSANNTAVLHLMDMRARYVNVTAFQQESLSGELKIPEEFCFPAAVSCGKGFECSCQPPQSNIFDRSYLEGRNGCEKILYGRIGETNKGEPTSMYYGWLGFNNFPQTFFTVFQA